MKVVFPYTIKFGKNDYSDCIQKVDLSEEEYGRVVRSINSGKYSAMYDDKELEDIYQKVWDAAVRTDAEIYMDVQREELVEIVMDYEETEDEEEAKKKLKNMSVEDVMDMLDEMYPRRIEYPNI